MRRETRMDWAIIVVVIVKFFLGVFLEVWRVGVAKMAGSRIDHEMERLRER